MHDTPHKLKGITAIEKYIYIPTDLTINRDIYKVGG